MESIELHNVIGNMVFGQCPRGAAWNARHPVKVEIHSQYPVKAQRLTIYIFLLVTKKSPFQPHSLWIASRGINFHEFSSILRV